MLKCQFKCYIVRILVKIRQNNMSFQFLEKKFFSGILSDYSGTMSVILLEYTTLMGSVLSLTILEHITYRFSPRSCIN